MTLFPRRYLSAVLAATLFGIAGGWFQAADVKGSQSSLNDGYSLFYDFCNQESQLSLLLWIKSAPPDIADYATRISATAKDDMAILKKFGISNTALRLDKISLPGFEIDVRQSMADDRKTQLIWGSSAGRPHDPKRSDQLRPPRRENSRRAGTQSGPRAGHA
jgi:hypothetical protein